MRLHILGICGTFMGSLAVLAKQLGHEVVGSDQNVYPPMSTQLKAQGIQLFSSYDPTHLQPKPDLVIVGNAVSRGNPAVEHILNEHIPYVSGPDWLANEVLKDRWVIAVSGTHGKTTTTSLIAWILEYAGLKPGFLIGGVPMNFTESARLGEKPYFVLEADEYDSAFFDKRSKFIHFHPKTLIVNNIEFDHGDIFADLAAVKLQFQYLLRNVPGNGLVIAPEKDKNVKEVLQRGCWTAIEYFGETNSHWRAEAIAIDGSEFIIYYQNKKIGKVEWSLSGQHNVQNGLAAIAATQHAGVNPTIAIAALREFKGIKRRLELRGVVNNISVYDDFAHHPTAIRTTLAGMRAKVGKERIIAVVEFGSNTMKVGHHQEELPGAFNDANYVILLQPNNSTWQASVLASQLNVPVIVCHDVETIIKEIISYSKSGDHVLVMSNKGFGGIHEKLLKKL